jgi:hypothetical protein
MPRKVKLAFPWLCVFVALWASVGILGLTAPAACDEAPRAFGSGVHTDVGGGWGFVSTCDVTDRSSGVRVDTTVVNWSGIICSLAGFIAAWLLGAAIVGLIDRRRGFAAAGGSLLVSVGALVTFFA